MRPIDTDVARCVVCGYLLDTTVSPAKLLSRVEAVCGEDSCECRKHAKYQYGMRCTAHWRQLASTTEQPERDCDTTRVKLL